MARLSIGEFARESGLTPKALRLYDELGLLPPAHVDPRSGYRSYERAQLEKAQLVARLRGLGMPLARIRVVGDLPPLAAATEVTSYWRQVEADTAARKELATFLVDHLSRKGSDMTGVTGEWDLRSAAHVDGGLVRESNEDAVYAGRRLFAVADGYGAQGMEHAASSATLAALEEHDADEAGGNVLQALETSASHARAAVREFAESDPALEKSGSTLTAMLWSGLQFALVHIGDSRAYLVRGGELVQLTHDHTVVQSLIDEDKLTPEEATTHPQRATLLRALHRADATEPDLHLREAHPADRYLLCSDGLHAVLGQQRIREVLDTAAEPQDAVDELIGLVHEAGAPDNVACVVTDVLTHS
ncbi:MerR family transcriptional regulator [Actinopolyspora halophila]|uniref:MerR family transcriptional regulator n=1 Tax=Actinopolyspora halophila TaxID=1850 RepID=UPI000477ED78|nr:MerR family transcriptional regulator [Actinopolyspora halophila]